MLLNNSDVLHGLNTRDKPNPQLLTPLLTSLWTTIMLVYFFPSWTTYILPMKNLQMSLPSPFWVKYFNGPASSTIVFHYSLRSVTEPFEQRVHTRVLFLTPARNIQLLKYNKAGHNSALSANLC